MTPARTDPSERAATATPPDESPRAYAERHGLRPMQTRQTIGSYLAELWQRRHFVVAFASARTRASFAGARLGQLWQVLTPILNAGVYFLIFGLLLNTSRGIPNFVGFLVIGIFVFTYSQRSVLSGSKAISNNLNLIRALHFPRAALPLASTLVELQQLVVSMVVMLAIVLVTGEPVTWTWLLLVPALVLQTAFCTGAALLVARIGSRIPDLAQLLPFMLRTWLYLSGVFYSIDRVADRVPGPLQVVLEVNPGAVYLELVRNALLHEHPPAPHAWLYAVAWAVVSLVGGFLFFYRAEQTYGRG